MLLRGPWNESTRPVNVGLASSPNSGMSSRNSADAPVMPSHAFLVSLPTAVNASGRCRRACTKAYPDTAATTTPMAHSTSRSSMKNTSTASDYVGSAIAVIPPHRTAAQ